MNVPRVSALGACDRKCVEECLPTLNKELRHRPGVAAPRPDEEERPLLKPATPSVARTTRLTVSPAAYSITSSAF